MTPLFSCSRTLLSKVHFSSLGIDSTPQSISDGKLDKFLYAGLVLQSPDGRVAASAGTLMAKAETKICLMLNRWTSYESCSGLKSGPSGLYTHLFRASSEEGYKLANIPTHAERTSDKSAVRG